MSGLKDTVHTVGNTSKYKLSHRKETIKVNILSFFLIVNHFLQFNKNKRNSTFNS